MSVDEFLVQAASALDVSQYEIENEFYMVDIPQLIEEKIKMKHRELYENFMILLATNNRSLEDNEFKKFMEDLSKPLMQQKQNSEFDREKFEQLRLLTNMGANRFR